jgi:hypothetical protein
VVAVAATVFAPFDFAAGPGLREEVGGGMVIMR